MKRTNLTNLLRGTSGDAGDQVGNYCSNADEKEGGLAHAAKSENGTIREFIFNILKLELHRWTHNW